MAAAAFPASSSRVSSSPVPMPWLATKEKASQLSLIVSVRIPQLASVLASDIWRRW